MLQKWMTEDVEDVAGRREADGQVLKSGHYVNGRNNRRVFNADIQDRQITKSVLSHLIKQCSKQL